MEDLGGNIDIILLPVADEDYVTKPSKLSEFKRTFYQAKYSAQLISRATVAGLAHGTLEPGQYPATLLIFEFRFISMQKYSRFTSYTITVSFEDANKQWYRCPEIWRTSPEGTFALHKSTRENSVRISSHARFKASMPEAEANLGTVWEMEMVEDKEEWAKLSGTRKELGRNNKDDAVVWSMEENSPDRSGIPTFLRSAVLLRREAEAPFDFLIKIRAQVDMGELGLYNVFGKQLVERVSPKVPSVNIKAVDLTRMDQMDLGTLADVALVTPL